MAGGIGAASTLQDLSSGSVKSKWAVATTLYLSGDVLLHSMCGEKLYNQIFCHRF